MNIPEVLKTLTNKFELFKEYETLTVELFNGSFDVAPDILERRDKIAYEIDRTEDIIQEYIARDETFLKAMSLACGRDELAEAYREVFDVQIKTVSCINRITEMNAAFLQNAELEIDDLREQIKKENSSVNAAAAKYSNSFAMRAAENFSHTRKI